MRRRALGTILTVLTVCCAPVLLRAESAASDPDPYSEIREKMVRQTIVRRGVEDQRVLAAMLSVRRHEFVPERYRTRAYLDSPLPIGHRQTISQPYIVARMTEALRVEAGDKVLEVGTGSGYQAAVLAHLVREVYSIEIVEPLAKEAAARLKRLGYDNVHVAAGDGYRGWPEYAPFDAIIVTAAPDHIPQPLAAQLKEGGRMVIPVGDRFQDLYVFEKHEGILKRTHLLPVLFVPMTGEAQNRPDDESTGTQ